MSSVVSWYGYSRFIVHVEIRVSISERAAESVLPHGRIDGNVTQVSLSPKLERASLSSSAFSYNSVDEETLSRARQGPKGLALKPALAMLFHEGRRLGPSP